MRVIYFTYRQSTQYLRFYFKPGSDIDGVILLDKNSSFVYFKTPQANVQETLRIIDKDIELPDCRFSYAIEDLFSYLQAPHAAVVCKATSRLLADLYAAQLYTEMYTHKFKKVKGNIARFSTLNKTVSGDFTSGDGSLN